jgi:hypothetical protein
MSKIKSPFTVLRLTFNLFKVENKQIFYPFIIIVFINLLALEVLYFAPRYPLSVFFYPIISHIWGDEYLHYPMNLVLLPKLFYYTQMIIHIFFSCFLTALTADMVAAINNDKAISFKNSLKKASPGFMYIVLYSLLSLLFYQIFNNLYGVLLHRAFQIHSTSGFYFLIKKSVYYAAPYFQTIYSIFVTALIIYIPILIVLEKKKFLGALIGNFKTLAGSFWITFWLVLIPMVFYFPLLLLRDNAGALAQITSPEIQVFILALSIFVTTAINIFIIASATTYYLYKKESI